MSRLLRRFLGVVFVMVVCMGLVYSMDMPDALFFVPTASADGGEGASYAPYIDWRYKDINGKLYRRLYNYTTQEWIGEWELVY